MNPLENGEDWKHESRWQKQSNQQTNCRVDRLSASNRKSSRASNNATNSINDDNNSFFYSETAGHPDKKRSGISQTNTSRSGKSNIYNYPNNAGSSSSLTGLAGVINVNHGSAKSNFSRTITQFQE